MSKKMNKEDRIQKERLAQHEAGHLTVAHATGEMMSAWISKDDSGKWMGATGGNCFATQTPVIAVSGAVAEFWARGADAETVAKLVRLGAFVSDTDRWHFPPDDELEATIGEALALLKKHKTFFDWAVSMLVEGEIVTDGMARDHFKLLNP